MGFGLRYNEFLPPGVDMEFNSFYKFFKQLWMKEHNEDGTHVTDPDVTGTASNTLPYVTIGNTTGLTSERALVGTSNQVTVTDDGANSTVTLGLPQSINVGATPTFTNIKHSALTSGRVAIVTTDGALADDADLTFATDTLTATKVVAPTSISTPSIITASGALGVTPAAGSGLNISLSTTGDLAVNTNHLVVDTSAASIGIGTTAPTGFLHIKAGTTAVAPLKLTSGTNLTTAEAGTHEYNGNHYITNAAIRFPLGGTLFDQYADVSVGGAETDIYTNTIAANTFNANGDKISAVYGGNFVTVGTELTELKAYFAGTNIWDSTGVAPTSGTTSWRISVELIRVSSTVVRYTVSLTTTSGTTYAYVSVGELTALTLSGTNILKITGISSGVGSGVGDIVGKMAFVEFKPAA